MCNVIKSSLTRQVLDCFHDSGSWLNGPWVGTCNTIRKVVQCDRIFVSEFCEFPNLSCFCCPIGPSMKGLAKLTETTFENKCTEALHSKFSDNYSISLSLFQHNIALLCQLHNRKLFNICIHSIRHSKTVHSFS